MDEVKECPFCGGKAQFDYDKSENSWSIECENGCCIQNLADMIKEQAIELWNKRI